MYSEGIHNFCIELLLFAIIELSVSFRFTTMLAKSDYLWHFYSIPFFCKKWSKIMKNTLVFLKQPRMDTFSFSGAAK